MRTHASPAAAELRYAQAHTAHYTDDDSLAAAHGYREVIASHPDGPEAGYSRTQTLAIVNRVIPPEEPLASHTALVLHAAGGRPFCRPGQAMSWVGP